MKKYEKIVNIILMALLMSTFLVIFAPVTQASGGNIGDIVSEAGEFINVGKNENSPINENALKPGSSTLYNVLLTWQFPPPYPFFMFPSLSKISASLYPASAVAFPTVSQKENVCPSFTIVPFNLEHVRDILCCLLASLYIIGVEKDASSVSIGIFIFSSVMFIFVLFSVFV